MNAKQVAGSRVKVSAGAVMLEGEELPLDGSRSGRVRYGATDVQRSWSVTATAILGVATKARESGRINETVSASTR